MTSRPPPTPEPEIDPAELDAVRGALFARIERERGLPARVRALPTRVRRGLLFGWTVALVALGWPGWGTWTLAFGAAALALGWLSLRPLHLPPLPIAVEIGVLGTVLGSAVLVSMLGSGPRLSTSAHLACFVPGVLIAFAILGAWRLLSRSPIGFHAIAGAAGGGMAANAFLSARCPSTNPEHLLLAHLSVLLLALILGWAYSHLRRA